MYAPPVVGSGYPNPPALSSGYPTTSSFALVPPPDADPQYVSFPVFMRGELASRAIELIDRWPMAVGGIGYGAGSTA